MAQTTTMDRTSADESVAASAIRPRFRFSVEDYHRLVEAGILREDERVELIGGDIITISPIGWRHRRIVANLTHLLVVQAEGRYTVSVQGSLVIDDYGEPEPDIVLDRGDGVQGRLPRPADIHLVIEVSDATLSYDLKVKLPHYARAGVAEVWVVDVARDVVERFSAPKSDGTYAKHVRFGHEDEIRSVTLPDLRLKVTDVFN